MALLDTQQIVDATPYAERAVRLRPADPDAHDVLGQILLLQGKSSEAVAQFQVALQLNPAAAEIRAHLAQANAAARQCASAQSTPHGC